MFEIKKVALGSHKSILDGKFGVKPVPSRSGTLFTGGGLTESAQFFLNLIWRLPARRLKHASVDCGNGLLVLHNIWHNTKEKWKEKIGKPPYYCMVDSSALQWKGKGE